MHQKGKYLWHSLPFFQTGVLRDHKAIGLFESLIKTVLAISQVTQIC